jgi:hypothetical protein
MLTTRSISLMAAGMAAIAWLTIASPAAAGSRYPVAAQSFEAINEDAGAEADDAEAGEEAVTAAGAENQDGVRPSPCCPPEGTPCKSLSDNIDARVCFQKNGDRLWVDDLSADGYSAMMYWENLLQRPDGYWQLHRYGRCYNRLGAGNGWALCDKDFWEDSSLNALGGHGSLLYIYACEVAQGCDSSALLVFNNA